MKKILTTLTFLALALTTSAQEIGTYRNPIIPGYHPDPSAIRVGEDYYLVNSSFEYFPGVPLYHSRDMVNWELLTNVLTTDKQLPLKGASSWLGIYAPTIRYNDGTYYMITTNVGNGGNFLVTAKNPKGPWSDPVWLEQQGIDPSLYFENGRCYMVSNPDNTIMLCEIDPKTGRQLTPSKALWRGTGGRYPEGPHIYKVGDYYYLLISEGGTELAHKLTVARSRDIYGPYESNPANPIMTNCNMKGQGMQIQGTGHGDLVEDHKGNWWVVFLAYRNFGGSYHHLGRETFLAPVTWENGWPVVNGGEPIDTLMTAPLLPQQALVAKNAKTTFRTKSFGPEWVRLQNPMESNYTISDHRLRLTPHGSLTDNDQPTFLGRRQESPKVMVETQVEWLPTEGMASRESKDNGAGLSIYQIHDGHADFYTDGQSITISVQLKSVGTKVFTQRLAKQTAVKLRITSDGEMYHFLCSLDGETFIDLYQMNCSLLSTEVVGGFTGVTIGMFAQGGGGQGQFDYFSYQEL